MKNIYRLFIRSLFIKINSRRSVSTSTSQTDISNTLHLYLELNNETINKVIRSYEKYILKIPQPHLINNCKILQKFNVDLQKIEYLVPCFYIEPAVMQSRILLLEEMGTKKVSLIHIYRFLSSMNGSIERFKRFHGISEEEDIVTNIFNSIGIFDTPIMKLKLKNACTSDYYSVSMDYYKTCHLKLYYKTLLQSSSGRKYQSFREFSRLLDILQNEFQFNKEFISKHPFLLNLLPDELNHFLIKLKEFSIGGMSTMNLAKKNPRILSLKPEKIEEILRVCKALNIPDRSITNNSNVLKMEKYEFIKRYEHIMKIPELRIWSNHPRMLYMIILYNTVIMRAEYLYFRNCLHSANIHTFLSNPDYFVRFLSGNCFRLARKKFLQFILFKELGNDKHLIINITKHPYWRNISLVAIEEVLKYLKERYSLKDIAQNIHLVLYPKSKINKTLEMIYKEYTPERGYDLTASQYLALCLYMLEKENHFSGDAVWQVVDDKNEDSNSNFDDLCNLKEDHQDFEGVKSSEGKIYDEIKTKWFKSV